MIYRRIFNDLKTSTLPNVSWVIPSSPISEHPPASHDSGVLENVMISADQLSSPTISLNSFGNTRISTHES